MALCKHNAYHIRKQYWISVRKRAMWWTMPKLIPQQMIICGCQLTSVCFVHEHLQHRLESPPGGIPTFWDHSFSRVCDPSKRVVLHQCAHITTIQMCSFLAAILGYKLIIIFLKWPVWNNCFSTNFNVFNFGYFYPNVCQVLTKWGYCEEYFQFAMVVSNL